ncbi:MAG: hypothetical protein PHO90_00160 [Candidatus Pacebacteria bacterium]|nr:hypothetical protein [Candidatus Paceibacterota bacterium]
MINQDLLTYIKKKIEKGSSREEIKETLVNTGWKEEVVEEAFSFLRITEVPEVEMAPQPPKELFEPAREMLEPAPEELLLEPREETPPVISEPIKTFKAKPALPWKKILIGALAVFIVAGVAFGGYYFYSNRPLMIIGQALAKIPGVKSFQVDSEFKITIDSQTLETLKQAQELEALNNEYAFQSKTKVDFINPNDIKLSAEVSSGQALAAEFRLADNGIYGKLNKAELDPSSYFKPGDDEEVQAVYEILRGVLADKWVKFSEVNSSQFAPNQEIVEEICEGIKSHPKVIKKITKTTGSDTAYGYKLEIDKNEVAVLLADITGLEPAKEFINQNLTINDLEVWIGKKTSLVEKLSVNFSLNVKSLGLIETEAAQIVTVQYSGTFANHNQAVEVAAPETFSTPETMMGEYYSAILASPLYQIALKDQEIISNMESLKEAAFAFHSQKATYVNFEKTSAFLAPWRTINRQGGAPLVMYYLKDAFCIQKELLSSKYYCVDHTGYSGSDAYCDKTSCDCKK